jgi:hypothetical protein
LDTLTSKTLFLAGGVLLGVLISTLVFVLFYLRKGTTRREPGGIGFEKPVTRVGSFVNYLLYSSVTLVTAFATLLAYRLIPATQTNPRPPMWEWLVLGAAGGLGGAAIAFTLGVQKGRRRSSR